MMQQYLEVKNNYKDCIVLFRLGDFYETFFDDARLVADELQIVLTSRNGNPMAGVPYHAIDSYVRKLISAGHKVAICEQTEDPAQAKGLVRREVTRVMTPGTIMEDELLAGQANNYILTVSEKKGTFAVVLSDISTGEVVVTSCESLPELLDIISSFEPAQILLRESLKTLKKDIMTVSGAFIEIFEDWNFALSSSLRYVKEFYSLASTDHLELDFSQLEALGALFKYLQTTNFKPMKHLSLPRVIKRSETMQLDASTIENLNLLSSQGKGSLIAIMDESVTGMGKRKLKQWLLTPLTDVHKIERRLDTVQSLSEDRLLLEELREYLGGIFDLERIVSRLASDRASPRDLQSLRNSLRILPYIKQLLVSNPSLRERGERIVLFSKELELLEKALQDEPSAFVGEGKVIRKGFSRELDELRDLLENSVEKLKELERREKEATGISTLKVKYNKVFGYFIELPKAQASKAPENYTRKQTLVNCERYITPELKAFEDRVLSAGERIDSLERSLFENICREVGNSAKDLQELSTVLSELDVLQSFASIARKYGYVRPEFTSDGATRVEASRHPIVERFVGEFTPNDITFGEEGRFFILTGPNMSGKSTYIRQIALISIMAQIGSFVPASRAVLPVYDRIFTRIGARDDLAGGKSTFLVEMMETATILSRATEDSLVILDEVGRGTSTFDGISIAWSVSEYIYEAIGCNTVFATHFTELTELSQMYSGIRNKTVKIMETEKGIVFLHRVIEGVASKSHGIDVAKLAGIPSVVLERAEEILRVISKQSALDKAVRVLTTDDLVEIRRAKKGKMNRNQITLFDT